MEKQNKKIPDVTNDDIKKENDISAIDSIQSGEIQIKKTVREIKLSRKHIIKKQKEEGKQNLSKEEYNSKFKDFESKNSEGNIVDLVNVEKYYINGNNIEHVLKNINLQIKKGEVFLILGTSGSGKTTLLNVISGLADASSGEIVVADKNLFLMNDAKKTRFRAENLSFVFQSYNLIPTLNIEENIKVGATLRNDDANKLEVDEIMKLLDLYQHKNKYPYQLSGGQNQRVSIGRALAKNPNILFADEPTGALDEERGKESLQFLLDINKQFNTTIIMVSHNPNFVGVSNTILRIHDGSIQSIKKNKKIVDARGVKWT